MAGFTQAGNRNPGTDADHRDPGVQARALDPSSGAPTGVDAGATGEAAFGKSNGSRVLAESELEAALQLLVERAQYITGATGTALALPQGDEMVCRASAGSCAPAIGARLQVRSGLTGESIARHQLLRCDNAETDPRVNLEACRALGIASIVVLPLLRRNGEVRGLFELFSDHPYAFEERDLIALERMADLTLTALDLAEQRHGAVPPAPHPRKMEVNPPEKPAALATTIPAMQAVAQPAEPVLAPSPTTVSEATTAVGTGNTTGTGPLTGAELAAVPEAMRRVQKCAACGFPVSEGRTYCLDCEKKHENTSGQLRPVDPAASSEGAEAASGSAEELPPFLANVVPVKESWLGNHVNLLAILVVLVGALVAYVVFH
jgi:putative methionine-R-sulfoxide reductase with GAF domain